MQTASHSWHSGSPLPPQGGGGGTSTNATAGRSGTENPRKSRNALLRRKSTISRPASNQLQRHTVRARLSIPSRQAPLSVDEWLLTQCTGLKCGRQAGSGVERNEHNWHCGTMEWQSMQQLVDPQGLFTYCAWPLYWRTVQLTPRNFLRKTELTNPQGRCASGARLSRLYSVSASLWRQALSVQTHASVLETADLNGLRSWLERCSTLSGLSST